MFQNFSVVLSISCFISILWYFLKVQQAQLTKESLVILCKNSNSFSDGTKSRDENSNKGYYEWYLTVGNVFFVLSLEKYSPVLLRQEWCLFLDIRFFPREKSRLE